MCSIKDFNGKEERLLMEKVLTKSGFFQVALKIYCIILVEIPVNELARHLERAEKKTLSEKAVLSTLGKYLKEVKEKKKRGNLKNKKKASSLHDKDQINGSDGE